MMCRSWKISVFGILSFMLAFGLMTTDAMADKGTVGVTVAVEEGVALNQELRAASEEVLTFTVKVTKAATETDDVDGTVSITIPSAWSRPVNSDDTQAKDISVGEVFAGTATDGITGGTVSGRRLVASIGKGATKGDITFTFKTVAPARAGTYTFPVSGTQHTPRAKVDGDDEDISSISVTVGPVEAGAGDITLPSLTKEPDTEDDLPYETEYILESEKVLGNLIVRFVAVGTMPKDSTIVLTSGGFPEFTHAQDDTEVAVSGHVATERAAKTVTAKVEDGGIQKDDVVAFTIKNYKAPKIGGDDSVSDYAIEQGYTILVQTTVGAMTVDGIEFKSTGIAPKDPQFNFIIVKPHGTGKLALKVDGVEFTHIAAGSDIAGKKIQLSFAELGGIGQGGKFEITIPEPWHLPFVPIGSSDVDGALTATDVTVDGRTIKGAFDVSTNNVKGPAISYIVKTAPAEGSYTFPAKSSSSPRGVLAPLLIQGKSPTLLEVTVGAGKGSVALTRGGKPFTQAISDREVGDLTFVFTAAGRMTVGAKVTIALPEGWTAFREDQGDGVSDPGEVKVIGEAAKLSVAIGKITATLSQPMTFGGKLDISYKKVKVPKVDGSASHTFQAQASSYGTEAKADIGSPNVGIGRAADGSGTLSLSTTQADAGSAVGDLMITYAAADDMEAGSTVQVTVPQNGDWPNPTETGRVSLDVGTLSTTATMMTARTDTLLEKGDTVVFTYKNITAPMDGGRYTFTAQSTSAPTGMLTALSSGVEIRIDEVASGSVALNGPEGRALRSSAPGMDLGNLTFVFTAGTRMEVGAKVTVTIPVEWTPPFLENKSGQPGESSLEGTADLVVSGGVLTATTNDILQSGNTLKFTYKPVTAPSTEDTYKFITMASTSADGKLLPVEDHPTIVVRKPVTAIVIAADPSSVFITSTSVIELSVALRTGTAAGRASLDGVVIDLDDGDAGGTFTPASITIAAAGHEGTATYTNSSVGDYTITATAGDLDPVTVNVEIKSTIRNLSVNGETERALVTQGGTIMVRATGPVGGGTVSVLNSKGEKKGTTKALDPIGDADSDGDQEYHRSVTLPAELLDGIYTISVKIQGETNTKLSVEVLDDQTAPTLSDASVLPAIVDNGDVVTISVKAFSTIRPVKASSTNGSLSVMADVSMVDSTRTDPIPLTKLMGTEGTYTAIFTISKENIAEDGETTISITATDRIGNKSDAAAVSITLENHPSELHSAEVTPASAKPRETIWINATGSTGGSPEATVNNSESGMKIAQVTLDEDAAAAGSYSASLPIVEDAHPVGVYDVTVTLGTKSMVLERALTIVPPGYEFTLHIPARRSMIHIPLAVTQVNGVDMEINTVRDVFNALGDAVGFITTLADDGVTFNSYLGDDAPGSAFGATAIGDDTGLIVNMTSAMTLALKGDALGSGGSAAMNLRSGLNLVGVPLQTDILPTLSAAINHPVFSGITHIVIMDENGQFQNVTDGPLIGGTGYFVIASAALALPVSGVAWENDGGSSSAAPVVLNASTTSVLHVQGRLIDEVGMMSLDGLNVSVRNLTRGVVLGSAVATDDYSMTFVKLDSSAAKVGDILEIKADSANPLLGVRPVQHVVTVDDVLNSRISLPDLVSYEIPAQSELLANYPNPFNPETWIPFRLAEDASVSVTIYGASGSLVRTIDVGFTPAAVYEGRSDAIYWDGRNNFGEQVSSGIYFYHLNAGDFSATRKMVIVK